MYFLFFSRKVPVRHTAKLKPVYKAYTTKGPT